MTKDAIMYDSYKGIATFYNNTSMVSYGPVIVDRESEGYSGKYIADAFRSWCNSTNRHPAYPENWRQFLDIALDCNNEYRVDPKAIAGDR